MISNLLKILLVISLFIAAAGASAYLTLSMIVKSEETVVVPSFKEKDVVYALRMLSDLGLNTRIKASEYSTFIPLNHIIEQDPLPGSEIKKGRNVKFVISRGRLSMAAPELTGLSIPQASIVIEENGLCMGSRSRSESFDVEEGAIIAQSPESGVTINRNSCIDLLVSSGRYQETFGMADLTALPIDEAILKIEADKLKLGNITEAAAQDFLLNTVVSQAPPAGYRAVTGQAVHLGVNRSGFATGRGADSAKRKTCFFRYRAGAGFLNRHVRVRINSKILSYDLFNDFISPAEEILFFIPPFENITVMLYVDGELVKTLFPGTGDGL